MKKINIILTIVLMMISTASQAMAQPKVLVENPVFKFESVPDGVSITHEFKIKNVGDTLLQITGVRPP